MTEIERRRRSDTELAPHRLVERFPGPALLVDAAAGILAKSVKGERLADLVESGQAGDLPLAIMACSSDLLPRVQRFDIASNNERLHLELTLMPVDRRGETLVLVLGRDVTVERKLTEALVASRRLFKDIESVSSDFGWETDLEGRFTYVSVRGALGYAAHELHGDFARRLVPDGEDLPDPWPFEAQVPHDSVEIWLRRKNGTFACCEMSCRPVTDEAGAFCGVRGVTRDVTERKIAEDARAKAEAEAIAANDAKSRFLAIMSHELRTPINGVIGNLELLKTTGLNNDQAGLIHSTEIAAESLLRIIGDILDFSKIEAGKIDLELLPYDPARLVDEVVSLLNPQAIGKGVSLQGLVHPSVPEHAALDPYRLRQILMNLVGNALKFTEIGGVLVTMHGSQDDTGRTWIEVRINDTGIGFDPMRVDLFQPFTQADGSTTRRFGGSGLGLSICRGLVERMGGKIGADSGPGLGATFWFKIPVEDAKPRASYVRALKGARIVLATKEPGAFVGIIAGLSDLGVATKLADPNALMAGTIKIDDGPYLALLTDVADLGAIDIGADARILLTSESISGFVPRRTAFRQGFGDILALPPKLDDVVGALGALAREEPPVIAALSVVPDQTISDLKSLFAGRQVLVLEDNPMSRAVVARQFQALGVAVTLVENGRLGLEAVESHDFAMVFTDCAMPEIDGYLFTQILRRRELGTGRHLPIIAMTANAADDDAKKCLAAGMDDYLAKPVRLSVLARVLGAWARGDGATGHGPGQAAADAGPVDLTLLAEILGDSSAEALDEALDMFGEFFPGFLDDARAACAQSDREAMIDAAHTAKGASRNAGALALGHALGQAEDHAKLGDFAAYQADLDRAAQEWTKVRAFIAQRGTIAGAATGSSVHA